LIVSDLFGVNRTAGRRAEDARRGWAETWIVVRTVLIVLAVVGALWLVYELSTIILLVVFSFLFAYMIAPLVAFIRRRVTFGRSRPLAPGLAIGIAYLVILGAIALSVGWGVPRLLDQMAQAARQAPGRLESARANAEPFNALYGQLERFGLPPVLIQRGVSVITSAIETGMRALGTAFVRLATYVPWLVVIPIVAFFLLKDAPAFRRGALRLVPAGGPRTQAEELLGRIDAALAAYIRAQLVACLIVGAMVGVGLTLLRVPYAAILGLAAGVAEFVPLVGPLVIAVVSAVVAALHAPILAVWVLVFLGVLRVLEDYVIYPRLIGSNIHLHPLAVILVVLAGAELAGAVGVLLSVPALAIASATCRYFVESTGGRSRTPRARPA
jgi:predicted PurR-regulated permease PerM